MTFRVVPHRNELLTRVGELLRRYGFDAKPSEQVFLKKVSLGRQAFHLGIIKHASDFDVTASVAVRVDAVEDTVNAYRSNLSNSLKKRTCTIGVDIGNLSIGKQKRWTVASMEDISQVTLEIVADFEFIALPYFERFSDLQNIYDVLATNENEGRLHQPIAGARCVGALALGRLLQRPEPELKRLVERNERYLAERDDLNLELLRRLADTAA